MLGQRKTEVKTTCRVCGAKVKDILRHNRTHHTYSSVCGLCSEKFENVRSVLTHVKLLHSHVIGYLMPESGIVSERKQQEYPRNRERLEEVIVKLGISDLGGTWLKDDEFFVYFDMTTMRPLMVVELMTPQSLQNCAPRAVKEKPYLQDPDLPPNQCYVGNMKMKDCDVTHLALSVQHRLSEEANDKTFRVRNLVRCHSNVNRGILQSVENHLTQLGRNWWESVLVTVPVYNNERETPEGRLPEPTHIAKMMFLGATEIQVFVVENTATLNPDAANFVACRSTLEEFNNLTGLNIQTSLPYSWNNPIWKCKTCRFMADDLEEVQLHDRFYHKNGYCPVHRKRHAEQFPTFAKYRRHVKAAERKLCGVTGCGDWYYNTADLTRHKNRVHKEKDVECPYEGCEAKFKTREQMLAHLKIHEDNRERYPCSICDRTFLNSWELGKHMRMKHLQATNTSPNRVDTCHPRAGQGRDRSASNRTLQQQLSQAKQQLFQKDEKIARLEAQLASLKQKQPEPSTSASSHEVQKKRKRQQ